METRYKVLIGIAVALSILAFIFSCIKNISIEIVGFEFQDQIITVLGILVTALIGWQIFNLISFTEKERNLKREFEKIHKAELDKLREATKKDLSEQMCWLYHRLAVDYFETAPLSSVFFFIEAVHYATQVSEEFAIEVIESMSKWILHTDISELLKFKPNRLNLKEVIYPYAHKNLVIEELFYKLIELEKQQNAKEPNNDEQPE